MIHVVQLDGWSIFNQLQLEEALLRVDERNWCVMNHGSEPSIVMGISGKTELLINQEHHTRNPLPIIRRFSGGGTVVVDQSTLFVSFICNSRTPCFPKEIMHWTEEIYRPVFKRDDFRLRENDYVFGDKKFGGNAQYIQKKRWLHHSTLLWDYDIEKMKILKIPPKMPEYRSGRDHADFLCCLKDQYPSKDSITQGVLDSLSKKFEVKYLSLKDIEPILMLPHRKATTLII